MQDVARTLLWVNGWGLSQDWAKRQVERCLPWFHHVVVQPDVDFAEHVRRHVAAGACVCGYSMGAFLLLSEPRLVPRSQKGTLISPYLPGTLSQGSRKQKAWLRAMRGKLATSPRTVLERFFHYAGAEDASPGESPDLEGLRWGLSALLERSLLPSEFDGYRILVGEADPLVNVQTLRALSSEVRLAADVGHSLSALAPLVEVV